MITVDRRRTKKMGREGQALVEFALVLPILVVLLLGLIEFGFLLYNQQVITNASREGARYGIVQDIPRRTAAEIEGIVDTYAGNRLITFGSAVAVTSVDPSDTEGQLFGADLTVNVTFEYQFLVLPKFVGTLAGVQELRARTVMKYE